MNRCKACGYYSGYDVDLKKIVGEEEFIVIQGHFTAEDSEYAGIHTISLLACPICHTVIMKD